MQQDFGSRPHARMSRREGKNEEQRNAKIMYRRPTTEDTQVDDSFSVFHPVTKKMISPAEFTGNAIKLPNVETTLCGEVTKPVTVGYDTLYHRW